MTTPSKTIIPEKHYLGLSKKFTDLPFASMVPYGTDAAGKKRMATVQSTSHTNIIMDNIPMMGFKITGVISRGGDGVSDTWGIEDPRGFKHFISSENLQMLHTFVNIERGEIVDTCVWARDGAKNVLLPTESEIYQNAVTMTDIAGSVVSWKDIKPGYKITMQNGITGRYIGKYFFVKECSESYRDGNQLSNGIKFPTTKQHIIEIESKRTYPVGTKTELVSVTNIKPSKIIDATDEISEKDAEVEMNRLIADPTCYSFEYDTTYAACANSIKDYRLVLEKIDVVDPNYWRTHNKFVLRLADGRLGMVYMEYAAQRQTATKIEIGLIHENELANGILAVVKEIQLNRYYGNNQKYTMSKLHIDPSVVTEVYQLNIEFSTKLGNFVKATIR